MLDTSFSHYFGSDWGYDEYSDYWIYQSEFIMYINPAGGVSLYQPFKSEFHSNGISLNYIDLPRYANLYEEYTFLSFLSLITINDSYLNNLPLFTVNSNFYD